MSIPAPERTPPACLKWPINAYLSVKVRAADSCNLVTAVKNCWTLFHHQLDFANAFRQFTHLARQLPEDSRLGIRRDLQLPPLPLQKPQGPPTFLLSSSNLPPPP